MKKFDGILICTDLDGTLLKNDKSISEENSRAIEYFKSEGGLFTFVTGRMPTTAKRLYDLIRPNAPIGCINGGGIYDYESESYVWTCELSRKCLELVKYVEETAEGVGVQVNTFDKIYFSKDNSAMELFRKSTGSPNLVRRYYDVTEPIAKIVFGDAREDHLLKVQELLNSHPLAGEFDFIRSERKLYEILPKGSSKGSVLVRLADHLGIDIKKTIAVGDYNNDVSMLLAAGVGIAVANACEEAKAAADRITVDNEHSAIAKIISEIEEGLIF